MVVKLSMVMAMEEISGSSGPFHPNHLCFSKFYGILGTFTAPSRDFLDHHASVQTPLFLVGDLRIPVGSFLSDSLSDQENRAWAVVESKLAAINGGIYSFNQPLLQSIQHGLI